MHILPRKFKGDVFQQNPDAVYPALEAAERELPTAVSGRSHHWATNADSPKIQREPAVLKVDADEDREPRTMQEMEEDAAWLRSQF